MFKIITCNDRMCEVVIILCKSTHILWARSVRISKKLLKLHRFIIPRIHVTHLFKIGIRCQIRFMSNINRVIMWFKKNKGEGGCFIFQFVPRYIIRLKNTIGNPFHRYSDIIFKQILFTVKLSYLNLLQPWVNPFLKTKPRYSSNYMRKECMCLTTHLRGLIKPKMESSTFPCHPFLSASMKSFSSNIHELSKEMFNF